MASHTFADGKIVIPFRPPPSRLRRPLLDGEGSRGEILLFTGVRYQRPGQDLSAGRVGQVSLTTSGATGT